MTLNQLFWKLTKEKFYPSWGFTLHFGGSTKNIYNFLKIVLCITSWALIMMLRIRQSIYLVLKNGLSTSFVMSHITFDEISLTLSIYTILVKVNILDTYGAMICSYFGIAFLLLFYKDRESCAQILPIQHAFVH